MASGGGRMMIGKMMKTEAVSKEKGESDFFCYYMAHTFVDNCT